MFFLLPVSVDYRTDRWPLVTFTLIGTCTAVYLIGLTITLGDSVGSKAVPDTLIRSLGLIPARGDVVNWFTHLFVHGGLLHLLGNMVFLFLFGSVVEDTMGRGKFLLFYFFGGLVASGAHFTISGTADQIPLVGASGAISACLGAFLVLYGTTQIEFKYFVWLFVFVRAGGFHVASWVMISFWILKDLGSLAFSMQRDGGGGGVAFGTHLGGMLAGFVVVAIGNRFMKRSAKKDLLFEVPRVPLRNVYICQRDEQIGPFSKVQVRRMLDSGALDLESLYWMEGMVDWLPVSDL